MAVTARYTTPIQIVVTPEMKARMRVIADQQKISMAEVYRRLLQRGLDASA